MDRIEANQKIYSYRAAAVAAAALNWWSDEIGEENKQKKKKRNICMYFCLKVYQHFLTAKINTTRVSSLSSCTLSNQSIDETRQNTK